MNLINPKTRIRLNLFLPQRRKPNPRHAIPESEKDLSGKTIVFTGGTDGMGRVAVEMLYAMGARVVLLGRNEAKGEAVIRELITAGGRGEVNFQLCDLASMRSVKECAERILAEQSRIDVLVNNAGINATKRIITEEGFETNWAVNYLGPYLLTNLLLERIKESAPSRVVNVTTNTLFLDHIDFDDIQAKPDFATDDTYTASKLSLNMFTIDLARSLEGSGVRVNYLYPGYIRSNLLRDVDTGMVRFFMRVMASPPEVGADRIVRLAVSSAYQDVTGTYVSEDKMKPPHLEAQIAAKREQIAQITENALSQWL